MSLPNFSERDLSGERVGKGGNEIVRATDFMIEDKLWLLGAYPWPGRYPTSQFIDSKDTKYPFEFSAQSEKEYAVPDLTVKSALYGLSRYIHPQYAISEVEKLTLLSWLHKQYGVYMLGECWSEVKAVSELDLDKAAGLPWSSIGRPKKGDALYHATEKLGKLPESEEDFKKIYNFFERDFDSYIPIFKITLKDEIRLKKPARCFLPAPVQSILVGNRLFGAQNERLTASVGQHPMTIGMAVPSHQVITLFKSLKEFNGGLASDADGSSFDANFPLWAAEIILNFRCRYLPKEMHERARRYYETTYNGLVACAGGIYHLAGNRSGHTNTAHDNSFLESLVFYLKAIRAGLSYEQFEQLLLYYVNGDDAIWSSKTPLFSPKEMVPHAQSLGVFWECGSEEPVPLRECTFLGMRYTNRKYGDLNYELYKFRRDKILNSAKYVKTGSDPADIISKIVALTILCFGDEEIYETCKQEALAYAVKLIQDDPLLAERVKGLLVFLVDDFEVFNLYTHNEVRHRVNLVEKAFDTSPVSTSLLH